MASIAWTGAAHAQTLYRIVGADGRVTFTDKPPAASAASSATTAGGRPVSGNNTALPFELRQVANRYPVTLYTGANCAPCGSGRTMLTSRGIPFTERTVTTAEDSEALQRISGEASLPFLTIGGQQIKGYSDSEWTQFLDAAGYPKTSALPSGYRQTAATPLVAVQKPAAPTGRDDSQAAINAARERVTPPPTAPAVNPTNPAGITF